MEHPCPCSSGADLSSLADCRSLVDAFYARVRRDPLLGPVFASRIPDHAWPEHLERMASFWYTVLFGAPLYHGNPRAKHSDLPATWAHFEQWLALWSSTVDTLFVGENADQAKARAPLMAQRLAQVVAR